MMDFILAIVALALAMLSVVMQKTYFYLPPRELKRQAARHEPLAEVLWRAVAYGTSLRLLLWVVAAVGTGIGLVLLSRITTFVVAVFAVAALLVYTFAWLPNTRLTSWGGRVTVWATPTVVWLLQHLHLVLNQLQRWVRRHVVKGHTGLFDRDDLVELFEQQKNQTDSRIDPEELKMAQSVLQFSTKLVRDVLIPRRVVKAVSADENIGPVIMDDLHKSGFSRFPVYNGPHDNIVGVLYLRDLVHAKGSGKVESHMHKQVCYVHEDQSLGEALHAILKTHQQLFVVVNSFEEYVGIITLEDVLEEVIGEQIIDEFDQYEDLRAVAARHAAKDHKDHEKEQSKAEKQAEADKKSDKSDSKAEKTEDKKS